jgi:hypothetical protein
LADGAGEESLGEAGAQIGVAQQLLDHVVAGGGERETARYQRRGRAQFRVVGVGIGAQAGVEHQPGEHLALAQPDGHRRPAHAVAQAPTHQAFGVHRRHWCESRCRPAHQHLGRFDGLHCHCSSSSQRN